MLSRSRGDTSLTMTSPRLCIVAVAGPSSVPVRRVNDTTSGVARSTSSIAPAMRSVSSSDVPAGRKKSTTNAPSSIAAAGRELPLREQAAHDQREDERTRDEPVPRQPRDRAADAMARLARGAFSEPRREQRDQRERGEHR
jgi:hypothetical protein